jgi:hypothetical protein
MATDVTTNAPNIFRTGIRYGFLVGGAARWEMAVCDVPVVDASPTPTASPPRLRPIPEPRGLVADGADTTLKDGREPLGTVTMTVWACEFHSY